MNTIRWNSNASPEGELNRLCRVATAPGVVHVVYDGEFGEEQIQWRSLEPWTRTRAITVAEVRSSLEHAALDVALCSDLVYLRSGVELRTGLGKANPGLVWALGRAGRAALSRGLLDTSPITASEAVGLGLAQAVLDGEQSLPLPDDASLTALTTARDLVRSAPSARPALEAASFRLIFASGDPGEGARAFLERRPPDFGENSKMEMK